MNALAKTVETEDAVPATVPQSETAAIFQIIDRAARDPNVDIDKMQRLMDMHKAMRADRAELEFDTAMSAAQEEMQPVRADANNPQTKSKYASFAALDTAIRPIYTKHGFSVSFYTGDTPLEGHIRIIAKVAHSSGHRERPHIDMPADGKGAKGGDVMTKTHATGSAVQYGRRYLYGMIFNIAVGKDDDGNAAGRRAEREKINPEQLKRLQNLLSETNSDTQKFCEIGRLEALPDMLADDFDAAIRLLEQKKIKQQRTSQ